MKRLSYLAILLLIISLTGCATVGHSEKYKLEANILNGTWQEFGGSTYIIETTDNRVEMVSIIDNDNEVFEVRESNWKDGVLSWMYYVPSTGYIVRMETTMIEEDEVQCVWENDYDNGTETLTKVMTETEGSSKKAKAARK